MTQTVLFCPEAQTLQQFILGQLDGAEADLVENHLLMCTVCVTALRDLKMQDVLVDAVRAAASAPEDPEVTAEEMDQLIHQCQQSLSHIESLGATLPPSVHYFCTQVAPPQTLDEIGRLGCYRLLELLGHGGMGVVFRAEDTKLQRHVALKVILPRLLNKKEGVSRFLSEARSAARIEHEHIVPIYHIGAEGNVPFLVMKLLKGISLDAWIRQRQKETYLSATPAETIRIGIGIAKGLAAAHAQGLIHRDIKPSNLWLEGGSLDRIVILDFGVAKQLAEPRMLYTLGPDGVTRTGELLGTAAYMAPEQARGERDLDARCDLFSLGCVLYQLWTGTSPFARSGTLATLRAVEREQPRPLHEIYPAIPAALSQLIMRLLEKDRAHRPDSAEEVARTLQQMADLEPALSTKPDLPPVVEPALEKSKKKGAPVAALVVSLFHWSLEIKIKRRKVFVLTVVLACLGVAIWWRGPWLQESWIVLQEIVSAPGKPGGKDNNTPPTHPSVWVKELRVLHHARVDDGGEDRGTIGNESMEVRFNDAVKIQVELSRPAYAYLLAFNADGKEQLLWPVNPDPENLKPDEGVLPPKKDHVDYPVRAGKWFYLNDDPEGGLQVFAVVVSSEPLPSYRAWKQARGPAGWEKQEPGKGVWSCDGKGVYPVRAGVVVRGTEGDLPNAPPLRELCRSLHKGAQVKAVEVLAFPVRAKEKTK